MELFLIRHGMTKGNEEKRYIGKTDLSLSEKGIEDLEKRNYPDVQIVFSSPLSRCIETAKIIYPNYEIIIIDELREIDFGRFEGKNYEELNGDEDYQAYIDSGGRMTFPGGEDMKTYSEMVMKGLDEVVSIARKKDVERAAAIVHGGTIMAICSGLGISDYFDGFTENGGIRSITV